MAAPVFEEVKTLLMATHKPSAWVLQPGALLLGVSQSEWLGSIVFDVEYAFTSCEPAWQRRRLA
jgi:hypothetical protein